MAQEKARRQMVMGEFEGVDLGDPRRDRRSIAVASSLATRPEAGLPVAMENRAQLEGLYRHLCSEDVSFGALIEPHIERTAARVGEIREAYAIHDTTEFKFGGVVPRSGLGYLRRSEGRGFFGHLTLAVSADEGRTPLGLLAAELIVRGVVKGKRRPKKRKRESNRESLRWGRGVESASQQVVDPRKLIHVADREADIYELLAEMVANQRRFIIRAAQNRAVDVPGDGLTRLFKAARETPTSYTIEAPLSPRRGDQKPRQARTYPKREGRQASLSIAAASLEIRRANDASKALPGKLLVNIVHVFELAPPLGQAPVEWLLLTSEPIANPVQIGRVVEGYRARWTIEEYFKAIKTGCAYESRQLESFHALSNLLAYTIVVAYALLAVRTLARTGADAPATMVVTERQLTCLKLLSRGHRPLNTARDALLAIAGLGGHLKNNGDPGWRVVSRGWQRLLEFEAAYEVIRGSTCDQS